MKTTLDLDDTLYRQLKAHAALNGQSVKAVLTDAIMRLLASSAQLPPTIGTGRNNEAEWVGSPSGYADHAKGPHELVDMRASVAKRRPRTK